MGETSHLTSRLHFSAAGLLVGFLLCVGLTACRSPHQPTARQLDPRQLDPRQVEPGWVKPQKPFVQVSYQAVIGTIPQVEGAEYVNDDEICQQCHETYVKSFAANVHRGGKCESCHGPGSKHVETRGKEPNLILSFKTMPPAARAEACLRCHEENACTAGARWRVSKHAQCGVSCTDCHRAHYNVPFGTPATNEVATSSDNPLEYLERKVLQTGLQQAVAADRKDSTVGGTLPSLRGTSRNLGAIAPNICYRCHGDYQTYQMIAGPHQICGPNGFNCTTCHDPHGNILARTRTDLCLQCHTGAPTMAWHSSIHSNNGVDCTDCHNPHPQQCVPRIVNITHSDVKRALRMPMSVQQPEACYKCHPKLAALFALPTHHPVREGKMVCSDCHDSHGQYEKNLREATVNLVCYKCHAEKEGPFAFEHPPVRENCGICHNPHGTVANNLLKQPATFLCLRCHPGHNGLHPPGGANLQIDLAANNPNVNLKPQFYTNCAQCHQQIHGTNRISQRGDAFFTR